MPSMSVNNQTEITPIPDLAFFGGGITLVTQVSLSQETLDQRTFALPRVRPDIENRSSVNTAVV